MSRRVVLALTACAAVGMAVPAAHAAAKPHATTLPPACVVVNGPSGAHLQIGYSPNGPADCTQLP